MRHVALALVQLGALVSPPMKTPMQPLPRDPSHHITGHYPLRIADNEDRATLPRWIVGFQRGFGQLQVAVYGENLTAADVEEAAIEWLEKTAPDSLNAREREERTADCVFPA
jgi:hypothetical protein